MFFRYFIFRLLQSVQQTFFKFKLRKSCNIGSNCIIANDLIYGNNCLIKDNVVINRHVFLGNNVIIGNNSRIDNITVGDNSFIETGVICTGFGNGKIKVGMESYIGIYNILDWSADITIGNYVHIAGPSTGLWTHSSAKQCLSGLKLKDKNPVHRPVAPIIIDDYVYIGGNCTIYPGIKIGHHSIVAPNSAVNKDIEPYTMVGGVPAKLLKRIEIIN